MSLDEELDELTTKIIQGSLKRVSDNFLKIKAWNDYLNRNPHIKAQAFYATPIPPRKSPPLPPRNLEQTIAPPVNEATLNAIKNEFWEKYDYKPMSIHSSRSYGISPWTWTEAPNMEKWHKARVEKAIEEDPVMSPKILALLRAGYAIDAVEVYKVFVESEGGTLLTGKMKVSLK